MCETCVGNKAYALAIGKSLCLLGSCLPFPAADVRKGANTHSTTSEPVSDCFAKRLRILLFQEVDDLSIMLLLDPSVIMIYVNQISGVKRNMDWAEEKWREDLEEEEPHVPQQVIDAGPEASQEFIEWKTRDGELPEEVRQSPASAGLSTDQINMAVGAAPKPDYQAWSLDPFLRRMKMPMIGDWQSEMLDE
jgi:hypothetical protein